MADEKKPTYEELDAMVDRAQIVINRLRDHLQQATDALITQETENHILKERLKALEPDPQ